MKDGNKIDAARIELLLGELRLSGVNSSGPPWLKPPTRRAGPPPVSSPRSPNRRWLSEAGDASNGIWRKRAYRPARPSTRLTSPQCR